MERIEVTLYPNQAEEIEKILEDFQVPYIKTAAESYKIQCLHYVIMSPDEISNTVIDTIAHKFDTNQRINIISHYKPESTISEYLRKFEAFLKEDVNGNDGTSSEAINPEHDKLIAGFKPIKDRVKIKRTGPIEGLVSRTDAFLARRKDVYSMILVSTVVALVGLVSNNVAVIIGAMLISPLMGPISSIALNSVLGRQKQIEKSVIFGAQMILSSIALAAALTAVLTIFYEVQITSEIQSRTEVTPILIVVALMLGVAGGLAMLTSIPEIIVGVAIAVALVPPATTIGIGIGVGSFGIATGASLVLLSNIIGMVIGFMVIFLLKGISPRKYYEKQKAKQFLRINIMVLIALAIALGLIEVFLA
ncbi:MAG: TIGR00341 family protein [Nitrososphaera sp.]|jgi:uncharacterized hydrophobic protein (TIGR00341 family)